MTFVWRWQSLNILTGILLEALSGSYEHPGFTWRQESERSRVQANIKPPLSRFPASGAALASSDAEYMWPRWFV